MIYYSVTCSGYWFYVQGWSLKSRAFRGSGGTLNNSDQSLDTGLFQRRSENDQSICFTVFPCWYSLKLYEEKLIWSHAMKTSMKIRSPEIVQDRKRSLKVPRLEIQCTTGVCHQLSMSPIIHAECAYMCYYDLLCAACRFASRQRQFVFDFPAAEKVVV